MGFIRFKTAITGFVSEYNIKKGVLIGDKGFYNQAFVDEPKQVLSAYKESAIHYGTEAALPQFVSLGLGFKFAGVSLDCTYLLASKTLSNTMILGLGYSF